MTELDLFASFWAACSFSCAICRCSSAAALASRAASRCNRASLSASEARTASQVLTTAPRASSTTKAAAVSRGFLYFRASLRSLYAADGGHASTASSCK